MDVTIGGLAATASLVDGPAVVALHGANGGTRAHPLLAHLHETLPRAGVGVVTFDRRGEGASAGTPSVGDFAAQADDAAAVAAWLRDRPGVGTVGCWGFSQGAWVAPLALKQAGFAFLVLVGACGVPPFAQMRFGVAAHLRRAGHPEQEVAEALRLRRLVEDQAHGAVDAGLVERELAAARGAAWWEAAYLPEHALTAAECGAWVAEMDFDPEPSIASVRVPTLLVYGTDDLWLPVEQSVAVWRRHHPDVEVLTVDGATHDLQLGGRIAAAYEEALRAWAGRVTRRGHAPGSAA